jgi:hypothetical protein
VVNWPNHREWISRTGNLYSRLALGVNIRDITGGYRVFRRQVLEELDISSVSSQGYCFQVDMAWRAVQAGFRVREVPITFAERERGASKMSSGIVVEPCGASRAGGSHGCCAAARCGPPHHLRNPRRTSRHTPPLCRILLCAHERPGGADLGAVRHGVP